MVQAILFPRHVNFFFKLKIHTTWEYYFICINEKEIHFRIFCFLFRQNQDNNKGDINENVQLCLRAQ